ncbi:PAS domain-containing sensor histidine kinase [Variovorax sp. IB41]|uniref:PAS domain-containing sensor histidine kinase n=1 Tax=Variovorax sp. IB41 TaxID=2779370 RepID=UPI0018E8E5CD|nr:PAS domain-containing sensor histidine kinase [Variovorax sp. IB41]MBJ2154593.1 PAS domain-containing sensor histidine kinase [Variovorax sp. IB41]
MSPVLPEPDDLLDEAPCGFLVTTLDGTILKVNATFCNWIGIPRDDLVGNKRVQELFTMGGRIFHQTHWAPALQMQGSLAEVKFDVRHRDGRSIPMIFNARQRKRAHGDFHEIAAFVAEDRNRYERELLSARKKADLLLEAERDSQHLLRDRALFAEQMVGIVSHDLRNPLSAILMGLQVLGRSENERRVRVLGHVRNSAERAQRLIEELLDFTQARIGKGLTVNLGAIDLHEITAHAIDELMLAFPDREIVHRPSGPGACVADSDRLAQLIGNLVSNAATYGGRGMPIEVRSQIDGSDAVVSVLNQGEPISPSMLATVFEPMVRGATASGSARSVGLGLFIVNEIAKAHNGSMSVTSSAAHGTEFTLRFPACRASE